MNGTFTFNAWHIKKPFLASNFDTLTLLVNMPFSKCKSKIYCFLYSNIKLVTRVKEVKIIYIEHKNYIYIYMSIVTKMCENSNTYLTF